jgi:hypothetical protein
MGLLRSKNPTKHGTQIDGLPRKDNPSNLGVNPGLRRFSIFGAAVLGWNRSVVTDAAKLVVFVVSL